MKVNVVRPRKERVLISTAITPAQAERLERICLKQQLCVSDAVRAALALAFEKYDSEMAA
jgi:hypothetical protein